MDSRGEPARAEGDGEAACLGVPVADSVALPRVDSLTGPARAVDATQRFITAAIQAQERLIHSLNDLPTGDPQALVEEGAPESHNGQPSIHRCETTDPEALLRQANDVAAQLWALRMNINGTGPPFPAKFVAGRRFCSARNAPQALMCSLPPPPPQPQTDTVPPVRCNVWKRGVRGGK